MLEKLRRENRGEEERDRLPSDGAPVSSDGGFQPLNIRVPDAIGPVKPLGEEGNR